MLSLFTKDGQKPILNTTNYYTKYAYDGTQGLSFDLSSSDPIFSLIHNERRDDQRGEPISGERHQ